MKPVRVRSLGLLAVACLLAAGCSATTDEPEPSATPRATVSVPSADGPGVTDDTIYLGVMLLGEDAPPTGTVDGPSTAAARAAGLTWPGGREVTVLGVNGGSPDSPPDQIAQIVCDQVEAMEPKVLALIWDQDPGSLPVCLAEQGVMMLTNSTSVLPQHLAPNTLTLTTTPPVDAVPAVVVDDLVERGWFGDDATTTVVVGGTWRPADLVEREGALLSEALAGTRSKGNEVITIDPTNADELSSTLLRLKADDVDHVLCWMCGAQWFATAAAAQDYDPSFAAWQGTSVGAAYYDVDPGSWGENARNSFVGYSTDPHASVPQVGAAIDADPSTKACMDAYGYPLSEASSSLAAQLCVDPALVATGLAAAPGGSGVNAQAAVAGLMAMGADPSRSWPGVGTVTFGPQQGAGGTTVYTARIDGGCGCVVTDDEPLTLDP